MLDLKLPTDTLQLRCKHSEAPEQDFSMEVNRMRKWALRGVTIFAWHGQQQRYQPSTMAAIEVAKSSSSPEVAAVGQYCWFPPGLDGAGE